MNQSRLIIAAGLSMLLSCTQLPKAACEATDPAGNRTCQSSDGAALFQIPRQTSGLNPIVRFLANDPKTLSAPSRTEPSGKKFVPKRIITAFQFEEDKTQKLITQFAPPVELRVKYGEQDYRTDLMLGIFDPTIDCPSNIEKRKPQASPTGCWKVFPGFSLSGQKPDPKGGQGTVFITDLGDPTIAWGGLQ